MGRPAAWCAPTHTQQDASPAQLAYQGRGCCCCCCNLAGRCRGPEGCVHLSKSSRGCTLATHQPGCIRHEAGYTRTDYMHTQGRAARCRHSWDTQQCTEAWAKQGGALASTDCRLVGLPCPQPATPAAPSARPPPTPPRRETMTMHKTVSGCQAWSRGQDHAVLCAGHTVAARSRLGRVLMIQRLAALTPRVERRAPCPAITFAAGRLQPCHRARANFSVLL